MQGSVPIRDSGVFYPKMFIVIDDSKIFASHGVAFVKILVRAAATRQPGQSTSPRPLAFQMLDFSPPILADFDMIGRILAGLLRVVIGASPKALRYLSYKDFFPQVQK